MLKRIRTAISRSMPLRVRTLLWWLTDREYRKIYRDNQDRIAALCAAKNEAGRYILLATGTRVLSGPFQGLNYLERYGCTVPTHKLLGTYEKELWPIVEEIVKKDYRIIIDIGAAEGYYVVGLAHQMPEVRIIAFEAQLEIHPQIEELANRNGIRDRIEIRGLCDASSLKSVLSDVGKTLVICDIEGAEQHVLNPDEILALRHTDILVEVHEHLARGVTDLLQRRFRATHRIEEILSVPRLAVDCPAGVDLPDELVIKALDESRSPESKWFWMTSITDVGVNG